MQSARWSLIETVLGVAIGFVISMFVQQFVIVPIWNLPTRVSDNLVITGVFTVASLLRGYYVRRFFNWLHLKLKD